MLKGGEDVIFYALENKGCGGGGGGGGGWLSGDPSKTLSFMFFQPNRMGFLGSSPRVRLRTQHKGSA